MAAPLLLRQGRAGALKTVLLEARMFRGLASTVSLSAESGKTEKGQSPSPKKQSPPKNVVEPRARATLLVAPAAAELSKTVSAAGARRPGGRERGVVAGPGAPLPQEGLPKSSARKTVAASPQNAPPPARKPGPEAPQKARGPAASPSSSSSSSSDSESEEEGRGSAARPRAAGKGKGRLPKPEPPQMVVSVKEKPHADLTSSEKPRQAKRRSTGREDSGAAAPREERGGQDARGPCSQKGLRPGGPKGAGPESLAVGRSSDHERVRLPTPAASGPGPTPQARGHTAGGPQAAPAEARDRPVEKQALPTTAVPLLVKADLGEQVIDGVLRAGGETLEGQAPVKTSEPLPVGNKGVFEDKTAALKLEEGEMAAGAASGVGRRDATQEPAPAPPEPFDNTTYRNLQHHDYTPYTFLDVNLDLSAFRLPQPSSGRESPRH
ncbi:NADH dehydrogenase [ubiquinone] flavoprotein 3, mitochondrial isoform X1 [Talpa occidentalis]|uniref:NADH dehydrogenase [ubiquinone] flavoprotein 3, mitochondrial isoform X1 n=1 Tax=Talpa occidentalis TaxID=50954 RepID=UPI0023F66FB7|nr:NADH dehydrogenase [ubiquinone] flavoprotein 3, mitochondrial isoform X1 [Talpa occidentalis]